MEEWFSGALAYPWLLASQVLIILLYTKIALDLGIVLPGVRVRDDLRLPARGYAIRVRDRVARSRGLDLVEASQLAVLDRGVDRQDRRLSVVALGEARPLRVIDRRLRC